MWFSIGMGEIVLVVLISAVAFALAAFRHPWFKWLAVASACAAVSTVITPADPVSTLVLAAIFYLFYLGGRFKLPRQCRERDSGSH